MPRNRDTTEVALTVDGTPVVPVEDYSIRFERSGGVGPTTAVLLLRGEPVVSPWRLTLVAEADAPARVS